jgi:hypothetical protein
MHRPLRLVLLLTLAACAAAGGASVGTDDVPGREPLRNVGRAACPALAPQTGGETRELDPAAREDAIRRPDFSPPPDTGSLASLLTHFDASLLAFWVAGASPGERIIRRGAQRGGKGPVVLCGYVRSTLVRSFVLGDSSTPRVLQQLAFGMREGRAGRVFAVVDSSLPVGLPKAMADTLGSLEELLGVRESTPVLMVLFASARRLAATFPIGWSDGVYADWTLAEPGIGAAVFAASRGNGIASHELVHVALKGRHAEVEARASSIPYVAEEALARTIGGSRGRAYRDLVGVITTVEARRLIASQMQDGALSAVRFDARRPYEPAVDVLGAAYRVALSACRTFPVDLLDARAVTSLSAAVNRLAIHLRVTPDAAVDSMAVRLSAPGNVFAPGFRRAPAARLACTAYDIPLERAHPP